MIPSLIETLKTTPRHIIVTEPTPLVRLNRLSDHLKVDLWIKRDDVAGPSFGGNKSRQLEYYFGAALAAKADTVLITGAVQSNFVRLAAAIAAQLGIEAVLQLEHRVDTASEFYKTSGNVLLSQMLGARIIYYPLGEDESGADEALYDEARKLKKQGKRPYVIPLGMNKPPLGALGYVNCAIEITEQVGKNKFDEVVIGSGSGASHIGMTAGIKHFSPNTKVIGSCVRREKTLQKKRLEALTPLFNTMIGTNVLEPSDLYLWDGALAPGYGEMGQHAAQAMKTLARFEGQIVDPVYTAKVFACITERCRAGIIVQGQKVLFIHSGGLGALFAYQNEIAKII